MHYALERRRGGGAGSIYKTAADEVGTAFRSRDPTTLYRLSASEQNPVLSADDSVSLTRPQTAAVNYRRRRRRNRLCAEHCSVSVQSKWLRKRTSIRTPADWTR